MQLVVKIFPEIFWRKNIELTIPFVATILFIVKHLEIWNIKESKEH